MCTLLSITANQDAINALFRVTRDVAGNLKQLCDKLEAHWRLHNRKTT